MGLLWPAVLADLVGFDDVDAFATETSDPLEEFKQDKYHRLTEEYGSNPDDTDRGVGLLVPSGVSTEAGEDHTAAERLADLAFNP
ncbi:hypothetical protein WME99_30800 [Sorangium sp. So ce136]|uniref:hypothetical protein n=1 Tax=Sorangium sp. So ce136 TaxID=3133284 RepID=UPI003F07DB33